jgi:D-glycero-D-manno-heptose 1,7-bisphosphate phosphatase
MQANPDAGHNAPERGNSMQRAVFLDRDGVINQMVYNPEFGTVDSPANPDEFILLPRAAEAVAQLSQLDVRVIVVSNQPGIAKGRFNYALLEDMTERMLDLIQSAGGRIDSVFYCLHHPDALLPLYRVRCDCRKPSPGLLFRAAEEFDLDLSRSFMIGDGVTDVLAGRAAGATTLFISAPKCYICDELAKQDIMPDYVVPDLMAAVQVIHRLVTGYHRELAPSAYGSVAIQSNLGSSSDLYCTISRRGD